MCAVLACLHQSSAVLPWMTSNPSDQPLDAVVLWEYAARGSEFNRHSYSSWIAFRVHMSTANTAQTSKIKWTKLNVVRKVKMQ